MKLFWELQVLFISTRRHSFCFQQDSPDIYVSFPWMGPLISWQRRQYGQNVYGQKDGGQYLSLEGLMEALLHNILLQLMKDDVEKHSSLDFCRPCFKKYHSLSFHLLLFLFYLCWSFRFNFPWLIPITNSIKIRFWAATPVVNLIQYRNQITFFIPSVSHSFANATILLK